MGLLLFLYVLMPVISSGLIVLACWMMWRKKKVDKSGIYVTFETLQGKFKSKFMAVILTDTQKIKGALETVNKKGEPAPIETGTIEYSSSNESVFTVVEDTTNENAFEIIAVGAGTAQLNYSADADLGEGVVTITGFTDVEVTPSQATGFNVIFAAPEEQ